MKKFFFLFHLIYFPFMLDAQKYYRYDFYHTFLVVDTTKIEAYNNLKDKLRRRKQKEAEVILCNLFSPMTEDKEKTAFMTFIRSDTNTLDFYRYKVGNQKNEEEHCNNICLMVKDFPNYNREQYRIALSTLNHSIYQRMLNPIDSANWLIYPWYVFPDFIISLVDEPEEDITDDRFKNVTELFSIVSNDTAPVYALSPEYCRYLLDRLHQTPTPYPEARETFENLLKYGMQSRYMLVMKVGD